MLLEQRGNKKANKVLVYF